MLIGVILSCHLVNVTTDKVAKALGLVVGSIIAECVTKLSNSNSKAEKVLRTNRSLKFQGGISSTLERSMFVDRTSITLTNNRCTQVTQYSDVRDISSLLSK